MRCGVERARMNIALEIHLGFAFFVFLVALFVGWVQMGRRTMVAIIGIQVLIGTVVAAWASVDRLPLPGTLWIHIVSGLLAMFAYVIGRRMHDRSPGSPLVPIGSSFAGFVLVLVTIWLGFQLVYR